MASGKKPADFLQLLDNHIFFNDLSDELLQFFFKCLVKKDNEHGYEEDVLVDDKLLIDVFISEVIALKEASTSTDKVLIADDKVLIDVSIEDVNVLIL